MDDYQLLIDIVKNGAWVDSCPREMLEQARIIYPEDAGFSFVRRGTDRRALVRPNSPDRRKPE